MRCCMSYSKCSAVWFSFISWRHSLPPTAKSTRALLGGSALMTKVVEMKALEDNSVEVVQLAKTAFNNLKVCTHWYIKYHTQ